MSATNKFHWKVFVSFYVVFSFLTLAVSGIVLYIAPPGRVANWSIWTIGALSKAQWQAVHTIFSFLFIVAAGFHLFFNWKVLMAYLRSKLVVGLRMKRELASATAAGLLLLTASIAGLPPFSAITTLGEEVKNSWSTSATEPPLPHAELLSVEKLAETVKLPTETIVANLTRHGIPVESTSLTVGQLAERHNLSPQQVYQKIQSDDAKPKVSVLQGGGWGRMTVEQLCERSGITVGTGLERLRAQGIEATATSSLRDLGSAIQKSPIDVARVIAGPDAEFPTSTDHKPGGTELSAGGRR
jgi:hypothetical protein